MSLAGGRRLLRGAVGFSCPARSVRCARTPADFCSDTVTQCDGPNPWEDCTLGKNCPWFDNDLKQAERCTTATKVPPGVWK